MKGAGSAVVVMSPHLDDAVLSCGALLAHLAARHLITVATVFTAAAPPPWSLPARRQLRALGGVDAEAFFAQRRAEDRDVLAGIGVAAVHLGFRDALFRRGRRGPAYPTFRFDAARELGSPIRTVYYSDFPYSQTAGPEPGFVQRAGLVPHPWLSGRAENASRIAGYRTQFAGLFRDGTVPTRPEIYWVAANDSTIAT